MLLKKRAMGRKTGDLEKVAENEGFVGVLYSQSSKRAGTFYPGGIVNG